MKKIFITFGVLLLFSFTPSPQVNTETINWDKLDSLIIADTILTSSNKISYQVLRDMPDINNERMKSLQKTSYYTYIKDKLLPLL